MMSVVLTEPSVGLKKIHSKRVEKMQILHSKRVEKMWKIHSKRVYFSGGAGAPLFNFASDSVINGITSPSPLIMAVTSVLTVVLGIQTEYLKWHTKNPSPSLKNLGVECPALAESCNEILKVVGWCFFTLVSSVFFTSFPLVSSVFFTSFPLVSSVFFQVPSRPFLTGFYKW